MAVNITNFLAPVESEVGATSFVTSSISPVANRLYLLTTVARTNTSVDTNTPTVTGAGMTWVQVGTVLFDTTSASRKRVTLFRALSPSPGSGALTIDYGGQTQTSFNASIEEVTGMDVSGTNGSGAIVQSATNSTAPGTGTALTVTLAAFSNTNNSTFGAFGTGGNSGLTVGSGYTQLANNINTGSATLALLTEWELANNTTVNFTASSSELGGIAIEIAAAPLQFDAASNSTYQTAQSSYSWSHTCTGNNRYLVVGVSMLSVAGSNVTGITYNGVAMTFLGAKASVSGAIRIELWGLVAPSSGSNTIVVSLSAALDSIGGAVSFIGVHQTSPTEVFNSASATNVGAADATVDVTTIADNDMVVDVVATSDTAIAVGAGQTQRNNVSGTLGSGAMSTEGLKTPAGAVTMSWINVDALATWSIGAIGLRDVNAASLSTPTTNYMIGGGFFGT